MPVFLSDNAAIVVNVLDVETRNYERAGMITMMKRYPRKNGMKQYEECIERIIEKVLGEICEKELRVLYEGKMDIITIALLFLLKVLSEENCKVGACFKEYDRIQ